MTKRIVVISDLHCGHLCGLTPPGWQVTQTPEHAGKRAKFGLLQREGWGWYEREIAALSPVYSVVVNGDTIDGRGELSGGAELITTDRNEQNAIAAHCINAWKCKRVNMLYGTAYHTGRDGEDWEENLRDKIKAAHVGSHDWFEINGRVFDIRHHVGSSDIPHGRATAILRDWMWNVLWHNADEQPLADVVIRSHVHYHIAVMTEGVVCMTTPALQGMGSRFGARRKSGRVHFGFVHFDITSNGEITWQPHIAKLRSQKAQTYKL